MYTAGMNKLKNTEFWFSTVNKPRHNTPHITLYYV
jgi:hypothetical protein